MSLLHVVPQITNEGKSPVAHGATIRLDALMAANVRITNGPFVESLSTKITLMNSTPIDGVLSGFVDDRSRLLGESASTDRTRKAPLAGVSNHMNLQGRVVLEPFRAHGTGTRSLVPVAHQVKFKSSGGCIISLAKVTFVRPYMVVHNLDVVLQATHFPETFRTLVALEPALVRVHAQMIFEIARSPKPTSTDNT